jgi:aryl-alcohol dehydrogenase-like predicted oxidoreductase
MAKIALGTYRMTDLDPDHVAAIRMAVESGVTLIDTSTNYMDGGAERAIALAFRTLDDETAAGVEIVSKFGYIEGSTMQRFREEESFNNVVRYADHLYHCIDTEFMKDQLGRSLARLNRESIDCYLIHNPEYYLLDTLRRGIPKADRLDEMLQRIYDAFIGLEQEVKAGRIGSYGISSNSFSKPHNSDEFLPYEDLVTLAENAARYAGNERHSFTTVQLPLNLLEREGLKCAAWAKEKGLRVLANRPLNAQKGQKMYRLADYAEPADYYHHLNALLELFEPEPKLQSLYNLVSELDQHRHRFGWIGDYEQFYHFQVVPLLRKVFSTLPEEGRPAVAESLQQFFEQYAKMVAYECAQNTRAELADELRECAAPIQECAMAYVLGLDTVDYVLTGMRKPAYVAEFTGIR